MYHPEAVGALGPQYISRGMVYVIKLHHLRVAYYSNLPKIFGKIGATPVCLVIALAGLVTRRAGNKFQSVTQVSSLLTVEGGLKQLQRVKMQIINMK